MGSDGNYRITAHGHRQPAAQSVGGANEQKRRSENLRWEGTGHRPRQSGKKANPLRSDVLSLLLSL